MATPEMASTLLLACSSPERAPSYDYDAACTGQLERHGKTSMHSLMLMYS